MGTRTAAQIDRYLADLARVLAEAQATDGKGGTLTFADVVDWAIAAARNAHARGNKLMFIGNGGSAATASHMANDFSKNGGMRAVALTDGAVLTCLGNDFGYEHVFSKQIEFHGRAGDLLITFSASGRSPNILNAVAASRQRECEVLTLSGFDPANPLRRLGDRNIYVASSDYGIVESGHLAIIAMILDIAIAQAKA